MIGSGVIDRMKKKVEQMQARDELVNDLAERDQLTRDANLSLEDRVNRVTAQNPRVKLS